MKNISIWQDTINNDDKYESLNENIDVDILIIGGGITGCSTFYQFKDDKRKVALVEKNRLGSGASSRSSAKITFLQENIYTKLKNIFGKDKAYLYYRSQKEALKIADDIVNKEEIDCDFKKSKSYLYTLDPLNIKKIKKEEELLSSFEEKTTAIKKLPNGMRVESGFCVNNTYTFHPLKYIKEIVKKSININHKVYENTKIIKIEKEDNAFKCYTENNIIKTKKIVLALHYPYFLLPYLMPLRCYLEKSFLACSNSNENAKVKVKAKANNSFNFNAINIEKPLNSIRYYNNYLLTVSSSSNLAFASNSKKMVSDLKNNTNIKKLDYVWSNYDLITLDYLPLIGFIDDNLILSTGYNTWGNSNGILASTIIKDLIDNKYNIYKELFNPKRGFNKQKLINYPINIFSNVYSFIDSKINKNKDYYHGNPIFTKINGKSVAIYKDSNGKEHIIYNRCPHLKCSLVFNEVEKTWDCPCHGSRFDLDGKCIMGPSNYNITYK